MIKIEKNVLLYVSEEEIIDGFFEIPSIVIEVGSHALNEKKLDNVVMPKGLVKIGDSAFFGNFIRNIVIPDSVTTIGRFAFSVNQLTSVIIPDSVITIEYGAFSGNQLTNVTIPSSVAMIENQTFSSNPLKDVTISSNTKISDSVFDMSYLEEIHVVLENKIVTLYKPDFVRIGYNHSKIINLAKWKELYDNDLYMYNNLKFEMINSLEPTRENANILKQKIGVYNKLLEKGDYNLVDSISKEDFFKACLLLGLFSDDYKEAQEYITNLYKRLSNDEIHNIFTIIKIDSINNKEKIKLIKKALGDSIFISHPEYIARINNNYSKIKKWIEKNYKEIIYARIKPRIDLLLSKSELNDLEQKELEELSKKLTNMLESLKEIVPEDVIYYIENNQFEIRENNRELIKIFDYLKGISQEEFDKLQDLFEKSKGGIKNLEQTEDKVVRGYTYIWSKADNPINLALGYIVRCCAKLNGAGQDIMVQSMINPDIQNLVILDENKFVVAKATAYYNKERNYILFNNVEAREDVNKEEILTTIRRAVEDQVRVFEEKGKTPPEIRIGMTRNDAFTNNDLEVFYEDDMLPNYPYSGYGGDANSDEGQGILYNTKIKEKAASI